MSKRIRGLCLSVAVLTVISCGGSSGGGDELVSPAVVNPANELPVDGALLPSVPDEETNTSVSNVLTETQLGAIESLGLEFNLGDTPPNVEGQFRIAPQIRVATTNPDAFPAGENVPIVDFELTLSNQDNTARTIDLFIDNESNFFEIVSTDSFISGSGNAFTVYFQTETSFEGITIITAEVFSGNITESGIENFQRAFLMVDNNGNLDENNNVFPIGTGSYFIDQDGLSERLVDGMVVFDGTRPSLATLYPESQLVVAESLGLPLNFGDSPPNVEGAFRMNPLVLQAASNPDDTFPVGGGVPPLNFVLSDQDIDTLGIDVDIIPDLGEELFLDTSAFVSGSGNAFTVFASALNAATGIETRFAFSGILTDFGIEDFQWAPSVLGDVNNARLFVDQDSLSERLTEQFMASGTVF